VLAQYGLIGSVYAESVLGIENPRVAVLNIGEEEAKGNAQAKAAHELLKQEPRIRFVGNVEGSHIFSGKVADVIVCDGFVGNTALKMAEGLYRINKALGGGNAFWDAMNYENVGGTPVLGVNAPVVIGHGISSPAAIRSMILSTERCIEAELTAKLRRVFNN
jgi:glycerol-3-phosphate acyltransferase PlsX